MDQDDPERRIAELESQLAERRRIVERPSAEPDDSAVSRRFRASPPFWGSKWNPKRGMIYGYALIALIMLPMLGIGMLGAKNPRVGEVAGRVAYPLFVLVGMLALVGITAAYWRHRSRRIVIGVTGQDLTVSERPGDVFSLRDAQLGPWAFGMVMGSALHLRCGQRAFVLGGRDHRIADITRVEAPPTRDVDAWLWAADFEELLAIVGPRGATAGGPVPRPSDSGGPALGAPIRCLLFPNPEFMSVQPIWAVGRVRRMAKSLETPAQPTLAIDVDEDAIRVVDPNTNQLKASAQLAQVTAAPEVFVLLRPIASEWIWKYTYPGWQRLYQWTTPVLVLHVPGLAPVSIACRDVPDNFGMFVVTRTLQNRFYWRGEVPQRVNRPADYAVSGADWLTLVEKFGLAEQLEDATDKS